jgi:hypothetical protein
LKQKPPGCSKIVEQQSEAKGISPIFFKIDGKTNRDVPKICENEAKQSENF